jgi:endonuclease/exonuclease/phosphatase (EEP) superfamily protein YafD
MSGAAHHIVVLDFLLWCALTAVFAVAASCAFADVHYAFDFLAQFAAPALMLALICVPLALIDRRQTAMVAFLLGAVALFLALRPQIFPVVLPPAPGDPPARIYFSNIWVQNDRLGEAAKSIKAAKPDVVALVEVSDMHERAASVLFEGFPYRVRTPSARNFPGGPHAVIASRWPVTRTDHAVVDGLPALEATVEAPDGPFRLIAVHLTRPWPFQPPRAQRRQLEALISRVRAGDPERTVVVGDFNATASGALLRDFTARTGLRPAPARTGDWPGLVPGPFRLAIENVFAGRGLALVDRTVGAPNGSDHRPLVFEVAPASPNGAGPPPPLRLIKGGAG